MKDAPVVSLRCDRFNFRHLAQLLRALSGCFEPPGPDGFTLEALFGGRDPHFVRLYLANFFRLCAFLRFKAILR
jgi:hypothetical protein